MNHFSLNSPLKYYSPAKLPCTLSREKVSISLDKDEKRDYPFHSHEVNVLFFGTYNHFLTQPPFLDPSCDHLPCKSPISKHHPSDPIYTHILFFPPQRILSIHQESRESQNPNPKKTADFAHSHSPEKWNCQRTMTPPMVAETVPLGGASIPFSA